MVQRVTYWLSLKRIDASNAFDAEIQHGDRLLAYRFTVKPVMRFYVINADRSYRAEFLDDDGAAAMQHLYQCLAKAYLGVTLALPIGLAEFPAPDTSDERNAADPNPGVDRIVRITSVNHDCPTSRTQSKRAGSRPEAFTLRAGTPARHG